MDSATSEAVAAVGRASESISVDVQRLEIANAAGRKRVRELQDTNVGLEGVRRSLVSVQSARTARAKGLTVKFDPADVTPFDLETDAGRKQLSIGVKKLKQLLLQLCTPVRGSGASADAAAGGPPLTASVVKCEMLLSYFLDAMLPPDTGGEDNFDEAGYDRVLAHMPRRIQKFVRILRCLKDRLKRAFDVLKRCRGSEARDNYSVVVTAAVPRGGG